MERRPAEGNTMTGYRIRWADGSAAQVAGSIEGARLVVRNRYPEASIGHDGDCSDGGPRTICWADEASGVDDDGQRAVATIEPWGVFRHGSMGA